MKVGLLLPVLQLYATNVSAWSTSSTRGRTTNFYKTRIIITSSPSSQLSAFPQHDYERNPYDDASSPIANLKDVDILLGERVQCKKKQMYTEADDIRDVLQEDYGIYVDDRSRTFTTSADNFNEVRGGGNNNNRRGGGRDRNNDNNFGNNRRGGGGGRGGGFNDSRRSGRGGGGGRGGFRDRDFGPTGHDYDQVGGAISEDCTYDETQIDELLAERLQAKLKKDFNVADGIQDTLFNAGVFVMDSDKLWRADGERFGDGSMGAKPGRERGSRADRNRPYEMADTSEPVSDEDKEYVADMVQRRAQAKMDRDYDTADSIREELRDNLNIQIDDRLRMWSAGGDFGAAMDQMMDGRPDLNRGYAKSHTCGPVSAEDEEYIADLVAQRLQAKKDRDYDTADSIRDDLKEGMGVYIDDKQRVWSVGGGPNNKGPYEQSPSSAKLEVDEQQIVVDMMQERSEAKKNRDYDTADSIRDHLKSEFNIQVDDKLRQWSVGGDFGASGNMRRDGPYAYSGNVEDLEMSDKAIAMIENLLAKRSEAKKTRDFETADAIRERLRDLVNVEIDDKNREWYLLATATTAASDEGEDTNTAIDTTTGDDDDDGIPYADDEDQYLDQTEEAPEAVADLEAFVKSESSAALSEEDEAIVVSRLARCIEAEVNEKDYDTGHAIRVELKALYGVELDDEAGTWTVGGGAAQDDDNDDDKEESSEFMVEGEEDEDIDEDEIDGIEVQAESSSTGDEDLSKLTVPELKERLRDAGLKVGGKKADLIERLLTV